MTDFRMSVRAALLAGTALVFTSGTALADGPPVEDRVAALEAMVRELQSELAAHRATSTQSLERVEQSVQQVQAARPATAEEGFLVGDTRVKLGGFFDMDAHITDFSSGELASNSIGRDFYVPGVTPVGGIGEDPNADFTAEATRVTLSAARKSGDLDVKAYLELDFLGSLQGDERITNSYAPRLRRAYGQVGNYLFGQEWTTFQNLSAIPESASFLAVGEGMVFVMQPQLRWTNGAWQIALENPGTVATDTNGSRVEADDSIVPDLVVRRNFTGPFGNVSLSGVLRQLKFERSGINADTMAFGVNLAGNVKVGERDNVLFSLSHGEGLGRYVTLNTFNDAIVVGRELEALPLTSALLAYRHPLSGSTRLSAGVGYATADYDAAWLAPPTSTETVGSVFAALLWDIAPKVNVGVELMHATRETLNGLEGDMTRFTFSTKYLY